MIRRNERKFLTLKQRCVRALPILKTLASLNSDRLWPVADRPYIGTDAPTNEIDPPRPLGRTAGRDRGTAKAFERRLALRVRSDQ